MAVTNPLYVPMPSQIGFVAQFVRTPGGCGERCPVCFPSDLVVYSDAYRWAPGTPSPHDVAATAPYALPVADFSAVSASRRVIRPESASRTQKHAPTQRLETR